MENSRTLADYVHGKAAGLSPAEVIDIGLLLGQFLADNEYLKDPSAFMPIHPDSILLDSDGKPFLPRQNAGRRAKGPSRFEVSFHSPAWIAGDTDHALEEMLFCSGMVMAWMMLDKHPYEDLPEGIFSAEQIKSGPVVRLDAAAAAYDKKLRNTVEKLLDAAPSRRGDGFRQLLKYALANVPGEAEVIFFSEQKPVGRSIHKFSSDTKLTLDSEITIDGTVYDTGSPSLEYRPGRHTYKIEVKRRAARATGGKYMIYIVNPDGRSSSPVFPLGEGAKQFRCTVSFSQESRRFYLCRVENNKPPEKAKYFSVRIKPSTGTESEGRLVLQTSGTDYSLRISVLNTEGTKNLIPDRTLPLDSYIPLL